MKHIAQCPAERAVYFLGGKWKIRIVFLLYQNKKNRFGELKKVFTDKGINFKKFFKQTLYNVWN